MPTTLHQFPVFIAMLYGGLAIGALYDVFGAIRLILNAKRRLNALLDLLFWILTALICFAALYWANGGELRLFCVAGFVLGAFVYLFGISRLLKQFFAGVARFFSKRRGKSSRTEE